MPTRTAILFICMGNICRSPLAEGIFLHKANLRRIADRFTVDSAGTGGWHAGSRPDRRAIEIAAQRGVHLPSVARQVEPRDFERFDHLLCMDEENRRELLAMGAPAQKVELVLRWDPNARRTDVPDPYYGGMNEFAECWSLLDSACDALLDRLIPAAPRSRA
ncbi:MAG TPA: low molecular weight protein-tyrosine-phosphatase [Phycisphaerales bacterium]|nr:low molecular weight protein-tyrosine-phosphatase [Phycisphaerales bacterium]HMP36609.1 low molecular weight protein-tyrosine-phosphatase [Phycisphaerales bacterium]